MITKKNVLRASGFAVIAALLCAGCGGKDDDVTGEADLFLNFMNETPYKLTINVSTDGETDTLETGGTVTLLNPNSGPVRSGKQITATAGKPVKIAAKAKPGYRFKNWTGASNAIIDTATFTIDKDQTVTANFENTDTKYYLNINNPYPNAASVTKTPQKAHYRQGDSVTVKITITDTNYVFSYWKSCNSNSNTVLSRETSYRVGMTETQTCLEPVLINKNADYTVSFDVNGARRGNGSAIELRDTTLRQTLCVPLKNILTAGALDPFILKWWNTERYDYENTRIRDSVYCFSNETYVTLYAQWDTVHVVTYHPNGATGTTPPTQRQRVCRPSDDCNYADTILKAPALGDLEKEGYTFSGWSAGSSGAEDVYQPGDLFKLKKSDTLYAQWAMSKAAVTAYVAADMKALDGCFSIGKREVTQEIWLSVMGSNPSTFKGDKLPVTDVSWEEVRRFIELLNGSSFANLTGGNKYRLPTSEEWTSAARGGEENTYSGSNTASEVAVYGASRPANVGSLDTNAFGLYDMSGNVWEWVSDQDMNDPNSNDTNRVIRGGGWGDPASNVTVTRASYNGQTGRRNDLGFRLAKGGGSCGSDNSSAFRDNLNGTWQKNAIQVVIDGYDWSLGPLSGTWSIDTPPASSELPATATVTFTAAPLTNTVTVTIGATGETFTISDPTDTSPVWADLLGTYEKQAP